MRVFINALAGVAMLVAFGVGASPGVEIGRRSPATVVASNWSGFYAGIHAGYGWGSRDVSIGIVDPAGVTQAAAAAGVFPLAHSIDRDGYVAGGQIGFNQQVGNWLWGFEADISGTGISGSQTEQVQCPVCVAPVRISVSQDMDWLGTVRARLGYASGTWLVYATGGLAYGRVEYNYLQTNVPFGGALTLTGSDSTVEVGWTVGGGFEYAFLGRWSARVEYLYYDLGDRSIDAPNPLAPPALGVKLVPNFENTGSIVRAGLNYRFN